MPNVGSISGNDSNKVITRVAAPPARVKLDTTPVNDWYDWLIMPQYNWNLRESTTSVRDGTPRTADENISYASLKHHLNII
jgi:hypothetical protein